MPLSFSLSGAHLLLELCKACDPLFMEPQRGNEQKRVSGGAELQRRERVWCDDMRRPRGAAFCHRFCLRVEHDHSFAFDLAREQSRIVFL